MADKFKIETGISIPPGAERKDRRLSMARVEARRQFLCSRSNDGELLKPSQLGEKTRSD
jgi:hypothetical protein